MYMCIMLEVQSKLQLYSRHSMEGLKESYTFKNPETFNMTTNLTKKNSLPCETRNN